MNRIKILLVGQPNVGKSSLLNAIVGSKVIVSNYPGTTVELSKAKKKIEDTEIEFIDTPGIYSLSHKSEEEKITERTLFKEKIDGAVVVIDSTALERGLYTALQILEAEIPVVVALNFVEEAEKKGIKIDIDKLKKFLNVPVIQVNPITKKGIDTLLKTLLEIKNLGVSFKIRYDDHIEKAIEEMFPYLRDNSLSKRFISIRILEGDEEFYKYIKDKEAIENIKKSLPEHPNIGEDIVITRYGTASFITERVIKITSLKRRKKGGNDFDKIILNKTWGPIITIIFFLFIFWILLYLGNFIQDILMGLTDKLLFLLGAGEKSSIIFILNRGLTGLMAGISVALPYVFLFYFILAFMEDIGILSRSIVNVQWIFKKLKLSGKAFIPLALGFGCTAPAVRATRILSSEKEKLYTASLFAFIPCSSRIAIIMGIVGFYGKMKLAVSVIITLAVAALIWILLINKIFHIKSEPLIIELPTYRKPILKNIISKSWIRMKDFVYIVIPLLVGGGIIYGILEVLKLTNIIVKPLSFITSWFNLPSKTIIPIIFSFLQKDLMGGMLVTVFGNEISSILTPLEIYGFGLATTIGIPCIVALGMFIKEFGIRKAILLFAGLIAYGFLFIGLVLKLISYLIHVL